MLSSPVELQGRGGGLGGCVLFALLREKAEGSANASPCPACWGCCGERSWEATREGFPAWRCRPRVRRTGEHLLIQSAPVSSPPPVPSAHTLWPSQPAASPPFPQLPAFEGATHVQPGRAQQHPGQVTQQDYISQSSACPRARRPVPWLRAAAFRLRLRAGAAAVPAVQAQCCPAPRPSSCKDEGQIFVVSVIFCEQSQHSSRAALAHPLLLFPADAAHTWVPVSRRLWVFGAASASQPKSYRWAVIQGCSHEPCQDVRRGARGLRNSESGWVGTQWEHLGLCVCKHGNGGEK